MAAASVLSASLQVLFEKLSAAAFDELRLLRGVGGQLKDLSDTLSTIRATVEDAEEKQFTDKVVSCWLSRLKDVAYEMDELLDEYVTEELRVRLQLHRRSQLRRYLRRLSPHGRLFDYKIARRIRRAQEKLGRLVKERDIIGLQMFCRTSPLEIAERTKSSSLVDGSRVFGREEDREKIISTLLSPKKSKFTGLSILPTVGMGGLGKTTLTQLVYNDDRIKEQFPLRMWVHVAESFDEIKLTRETLESASASGISCSTTTNMNLLQEDLCTKVQGKRFLLVLDDVWNEDPSKWQTYYSALVAGGKGSRIVVTTQNENVGRMMGAMPPFHLTELSDDDSWKLFRNHAFVDGDSAAYPKLEEVGKEIVKKLKGLPLAAIAVGCLLYSKVDEEHWMNILKSQIWDLPPDKNNILPALRLSYKHLPPHLKQCFAFCSVFHKDHEFLKESLVQIWMALGFVQPRGKEERMEDVGNSYFDDLVSRSFFQFHKGKYVMNYAIHGLAQSFSLDDCLRLEDLARNNNVARVKHLSFSCDNSKRTSFEAFYEFRGIRTLLLLHGYKSPTSPLPNDLFCKLKYLRVLTLHRRDISELPDSIGNLKQLRFLDLSGTGIGKLPATISKLYNLQTLKLRNCELLDEIENGVTRLVNLRHLEAHTRLVTPIPKIGSLTCLQRLEEFVIRKDKGYKISELKNMSELRGHLCISNLEHVSCEDEASDAMLGGKEYLTGLDLVWSDEMRSRTEAEQLHVRVLEVLQPHSGLKELKIKGFAGAKFPKWLISLRYLHTINLFDCERCESLPPLGQLPLLKYLEIGGLHAVARIGREFSGNGCVKRFPSLKELVLADMPNLREWICEEEDEEGEFFPCLTDLEVQNCLALRELPHLPPKLERLRISEAGLHVLPSVRVSDDSSPSSYLSSLHIDLCPNLESLERGLLTQQLRALKNLTISNCEELTCLPVEGFGTLASLRRLHIYRCPRLDQLERKGSLLPCLLKELQIRSCSKLTNSVLLELHDLSSLANLTIADCDDLYHFPEEGLSATIEFLSISDCKNLQNVPADLKELSSLKMFTIFNCPQVPCLPAEGLPERLQELYIKDCPLLTDRCQENVGADWPKIAHIPSIDVDEDGLVPERIIYRRR